MANQEHVDLFIAGKKAIIQWRKKNPNEALDLSGHKFRNLKMTGLEIGKANLNNTEFIDCTFNKVIFKGSYYNFTFRACSLVETNFSGSELEEIQFFSSNLQKADFTEARITSCRFNHSQCSNVDFSSSQIFGLCAYETVFSGATFKAASITDAQLRGLDFTGSQFKKANLNEVDFHGSKLNNVSFSEAKLEDVSFSNADLEKADFDGSYLGVVDFHAHKLNDLSCSHFYKGLYDTQSRRYWERVTDNGTDKEALQLAIKECNTAKSLQIETSDPGLMDAQKGVIRQDTHKTPIPVESPINNMNNIVIKVHEKDFNDNLSFKTLKQLAFDNLREGVDISKGPTEKSFKAFLGGHTEWLGGDGINKTILDNLEFFDEDKKVKKVKIKNDSNMTIKIIPKK